MNVPVVTQSILAIIEKYQKFIDEVTEDEFCKTPQQDAWSYSEVYSHIIQANFRSLLAIQKCIYGKAETAKSISLLGWIILFMGKFPPIKLKTPENLAVLVKKISREEARNDLIKLKGKLLSLAPKIPKCSTTSRIKHPRLGNLNACEWLRFVEIHSIHHFKQLGRITKQLAC